MAVLTQSPTNPLRVAATFTPPPVASWTHPQGQVLGLRWVFTGNG
jgi:hypothetical protein